MSFGRIAFIVFVFIVSYLLGVLATATCQAAGILPANSFFGNGVPLLIAAVCVWAFGFRVWQEAPEKK